MPTLVARQLDGAGARLTVDVDDALRAAHTAIGQYCVIELDGAKGYFALASRPGARQFEFYIAPGGAAADALLAAPIGAELAVSAPAGRGFGVEGALAAGGALTVLATGSALGAVMGAIQAGCAADADVTLYYGCRQAADAPFQAELEALPVRRVLVCSQVGDIWAGRHGYVQRALAEDMPDLSDAWVIACGQSAMQTEAQAVATDLGLPADRFLTNY